MIRPATVHVTQVDIDNCQPDTHNNNCIAVVLKRIKKRQDIKAYVHIGEIHIGKRVYDMDLWPHNRLIIQANGYKIEPFEFELTTWRMQP